MESTFGQTLNSQVAEVELVYKSKVKPSQRLTINSSKDAADVFRQLWDENKIEFIEQFKVLFLNKGNKILGQLDLSTGGMTGTVADPRVILVGALKIAACNIIISHNHPSGNIKPSRADEEITMKLKAAASFLEMKLLDHIIVTTEGYFSFADQGII